MIGSDLLRFSNKKIFLFDFETQRLNLMEDNLPFQLSWAVADKHSITSSTDYYLKWPNFKMSKEAAVITKFSQKWVENGTDPEFVLNAFESYLMDDSYIIAGHNLLGFDIFVHQIFRRALGRKVDYSYVHRVIDTNVLARAYKLKITPDKNNLLAWQYKIYSNPQRGVKTSLGLMAKELGMNVDENRLHESGYDLTVNHFVYNSLINLVEI